MRHPYFILMIVAAALVSIQSRADDGVTDFQAAQKLSGRYDGTDSSGKPCAIEIKPVNDSLILKISLDLEWTPGSRAAMEYYTNPPSDPETDRCDYRYKSSESAVGIRFNYSYEATTLFQLDFSTDAAGAPTALELQSTDSLSATLACWKMKTNLAVKHLECRGLQPAR